MKSAMRAISIGEKIAGMTAVAIFNGRSDGEEDKGDEAIQRIVQQLESQRK